MVAEGRLGEALAFVDGLLQSAPADPMFVLARASILFEWGRYREALPLFLRAEELGVKDFELYVRTGWTCMWMLGAAAAEGWMRKAVEANEDEWTGHFGLGSSLRAQNKVDLAIEAFEIALEVAPNNLHCLGQLFDCMLTQKRTQAAERYARRAIAADPTIPVVWTNLGVALAAQDRREEAIASFEHGEQLAEKGAGESDRYLNLAICLRETGRLDEAIELYERKLPHVPTPKVNTDYAHALVTAGRLPEGWDQYEFRWLHAPLLALRPPFRKPLWTGQDLADKTILLRTEQGIGDVFQFIRYAPHIKSLGATVLLQVRPGIGELALSFPGIDRVLKPDEPYPEFDFYVHLMSLPSVFGTDLASIPAAVPYLAPDAERCVRWRDRLTPRSEPMVGLVWAGDHTHVRDHYRSIALSMLAPLADVPGVQFHSFQTGAAAEQCANSPFGLRLLDLGPELRDFADTAAALDQLDLLISVDTSVAHLAGALGKVVWLLVPSPADSRWMTTREDSPWYPTMRLFRQRTPGDWTDAIASIKTALDAFVRTPLQRVKRKSTAKAADGTQKHALKINSTRNRTNGLCAPAETCVGIVQYLPDQPFVGRSIAQYGEYLRGQTERLVRLIKPGSIAMEVGTGIGVHALALAPWIGNAGHFFLYEARPLVQHVLQQNLAANGIGNVTIMKRALRGQLPNASVMQLTREQTSDDSRTPQAETETIDELRLESLHWLKINEAVNPSIVLEGATESLWRLRPNLFVAVPDDVVLSVIALRVRDSGYQCWKVDTPYFDSANFNHCDGDIFDGCAAIALLAIPEESEITIQDNRCTRLQ
jgi:tetratricopeptide (TPR) repeat protein